MSGSSVTVAGHTRAQPPSFTMAQWQELEHQALIFKYLKAGLSVPSDLLLPIRRNLDLISTTILHRPAALGYCSYYGKKIDPEPGRCRRTDGKKWRCSKDAYADSKYCERHMNRSRNRSRKPVESQNTSQSLSNAALEIAIGSNSDGGSFQNVPLHSSGNPGGLCFESKVSCLHMEPIPYGISSKEYRCHQGLKLEADEHVSLPIASGSMRCPGMNSTVDSAWHLTTSQILSNPLPDPTRGAFMQSNCTQLQTPQDFEPTIDAAMSKQQQEHYFFGREHGSPRFGKQEHHSISNECLKTINIGSYFNAQIDNKNSLSTTQLSMSIPTASAEFFMMSGNSLNDA